MLRRSVVTIVTGRQTPQTQVVTTSRAIIAASARALAPVSTLHRAARARRAHPAAKAAAKAAKEVTVIAATALSRLEKAQVVPGSLSPVGQGPTTVASASSVCSSTAPELPAPHTIIKTASVGVKMA